MNWWYYDGAKQVGPITEAELIALRRAGTVTADNIVWREGLANWAPYREVGPAVNLELAGSTSAPPIIPASSLDASQAVCAECGRVFPKESMITHGQHHVCAGCKPVFVQKLAEGAPVGLYGSLPGLMPRMRFAGFWVRFLARMLDGILLSMVLYVPMFIVLAVTGGGIERMGARSNEFGPLEVFMLVWQLFFYILFAGYEIFFVGKYGATPGKMALQLRVVMADGGKLTYGRATGRFFGYLLSGMICYIGYIIAGFDDEKRALHDHICSTRVIYKN